MIHPKPEIYAALQTLDATVQQGSQKTVTSLPAVTFYLLDNNTTLNLDNKITSQDVSVSVDIWAKTSTAADSLLGEVETRLRAIGYRLSFQMDIPDPQDLCHVNTRFDGIK